MLASIQILRGQFHRQAEEMVVKLCKDARFTASVIASTSIAQFIEHLPVVNLAIDKNGMVYITK